jgi:hypothetical protein
VGFLVRSQYCRPLPRKTAISGENYFDSEYDDPSEVNREAIEAYLGGGSKAVAVGTLAAPVEESVQEAEKHGHAIGDAVKKAMAVLRDDFIEVASLIPDDDKVQYGKLSELLQELEKRPNPSAAPAGERVWSGISGWSIPVS